MNNNNSKNDINRIDNNPQDLSPLLTRYAAAQKRRDGWESLWQDCYDFALPDRTGFTYKTNGGAPRHDKIYDATAVDAAEKLAASLLGHLTPTWSQWFGLKAGPYLSDAEAETLAPILERAAKIIQNHFDRSNFAVEIHQCYLDLVVGGTASLYFGKARAGSVSAFNFSAAALSQFTLEEGENEILDTTYRILKLTYAQITSRYPDAPLPNAVLKSAERDPQTTFNILETVMPEGLIYTYHAVLMVDGEQPVLLNTGRFDHSPFIGFRWLKSPGEVYGRSPVMKALPDIKTANKVVELVLKNASIAVTGIWQADDDGVLNPANIKLTPGSIIPKAIGSKGLQPLDMPGRFDVSELMLGKLQARIRHALMGDAMAPIDAARMSATEVLERSAHMSMLLGATYGRLQTELLTPLITRAFSILKRRGEIPDIALDGRLVMVDYRSPLARAQGQRNVQNTLSWINTALNMGAEGAASVNIPNAIKFLGDALGVPSDLIVKDLIKAEDMPLTTAAMPNDLPPAMTAPR